MDTELPLFKEHVRLGRRANRRDLPKIVCRKVELSKDIDGLIKIAQDAFFEINGDSKSEVVDIEINGLKHSISTAEARLYWYAQQMHDILVLEEEGVFKGLLICRTIFEGVTAIRIFYLAPEIRGAGLGHKLVQSCNPGHTIIFQTLKDQAPNKLFDAILNEKIKKISEDQRFNNWSMGWRI